MKYARQIVGLALLAAAYWIFRGRFAAMSFEVKAGNSWGGVLSDVEYLIPSVGALIAAIGGILAATGANGRWPALIGTFLVLLFMALVGGISGRLSMIEPFMLPGILMLATTIGLFVLKPK